MCFGLQKGRNTYRVIPTPLGWTKFTMNTKKRKEEFLKAYKAKALNISSACTAAGISRMTYYKWRKQQSFDEECRELEDSFKDWVESQITKKMSEGDNTMLIFYSKCKMKDRGYVERQEVEHSGEMNTNFKIEVIESDEKRKD